MLIAVTLAAITPASAQTASGPASTAADQLLNLGIGMGLVLALIAACAWLVKKLGPRTLAANGILRVITGAAVGQRERVVVVEIGDTWLVLGVAPGSINALHQMPRSTAAVAAASPSAQQPFATWLKQFMEKRGAR